MRQIAYWLIGIAFASSAFAAPSADWGVLREYPERIWTTAPSPSPRVTIYSWEVPGRVLVAMHGFDSMRQTVGDRFADTIQRMELNERSHDIEVTYTYTDGRPALKSVMRAMPDGRLLESFSDHSGTRFRNTYFSKSARTSVLKRERFNGSQWIELPSTERHGTSTAEAEQERLAAIDKAKRDNAASQRSYQEMLAARAAAAEQQSQRDEEAAAFYASTPSPLSVLNGLSNSIDSQTQQQKVQFDRQMQSYNESGRSGGAIAVGSSADKGQPSNPGHTPTQPSATSGSTSANSAGNTPPTSADSPASKKPAPRQLWSWCWASDNSRAVFMSAVGSKNVSVDEQQQWRSQMESEFRQQIGVSPAHLQCDIDDDGDFSYTRSSVAKDNPRQIPWAPH